MLLPNIESPGPDEADRSTEDIGDTIFNNDFNVTENLDAYWQRIQGVYIEAEGCQNSHNDENVWVEVV
jgi:hypothetical protein